jgi:hypothetical protein
MQPSTNRFSLCSRIALAVAAILSASAYLIDGGSGSFISFGDDPVGDAVMMYGNDPVTRTLSIVSALGYLTAFITCIIGWRQTKQFPLVVLPISGFVVVGVMVSLWFALVVQSSHFP